LVIGTAASIALIVFVILFGLVTVALLGIVAFCLVKMQQQIDRLTTMAEPLAQKASTTLDEVQRVTVNVGDRADTILGRGETLTDHVASKVEQTATVIQSTVTSPLIKLSSLVNGIIAALTAYTRATTGASPKGAGNGSAK
jgi:predicted PurR-regulated permease PerM